LTDTAVKRVTKILANENTEVLKNNSEFTYSLYKLIMAAIDFHMIKKEKIAPMYKDIELMNSELQYLEPLIDVIS